MRCNFCRIGYYTSCSILQPLYIALSPTMNGGLSASIASVMIGKYSWRVLGSFLVAFSQLLSCQNEEGGVFKAGIELRALVCRRLRVGKRLPLSHWGKRLTFCRAQGLLNRKTEIPQLLVIGLDLEEWGGVGTTAKIPSLCRVVPYVEPTPRGPDVTLLVWNRELLIVLVIMSASTVVYMVL